MLPPTYAPRGSVALALLALAATPLGAQTVPPLPASAPSPVQLSPFTVSTDPERGYAASSTLAGTRLNTSLRDIAAAVTVITPEFMADLGVHTLQDVIGYTVNAEVSVGSANGLNQSPSSVRIRGAGTGETRQDFFRVYFPLDDYNLDQISINRGPNSLLFGVGNPAGTITGVSKRAHFANQRAAELSVDRWGGWRATLDFNQAIAPGRVALRVAALHRDAQQSVEPAHWEEDRLYLTGTAVLSTRRNWRSTARLHFEQADAKRVLLDLRTAGDVITPWLAAGAPLVEGVRGAANTVTLPRGTARTAGTNQIVVIDGSPAEIPVLNWLNTARGGLATFEDRSLRPGGPVPHLPNYNGPTRSSDYRSKGLMFFLEQELGGRTAAEFAYGQSERDLDWVRSEGGGSLFVDVNRLLPNGAPNPNAGKFYTQGTSRIQKQFNVARETRLTLSHTADLRGLHRWLGQHRLGALVGRDFNTFALDDLFEANATALPGFPARIDNVQNRVVRRSYLFLGRGDVWLDGRDFSSLAPVARDGVASRYFNDRVVRTDSTTDSLVFGLQSRWLQERLVTTFGYRWDELEGYALDGPASVRPATGEFTHWRDYPLTARPVSAQRNRTGTTGAVLHLLPQISLQANRSETSAPASGLFDMYGRALPTPLGRGYDYGFKFSLLGGRLNATLTRYRSSQENQSNSSMQTLGPRINQIGLVLNVPVLVAVNDPRDTQDIVARGYELDLAFNPTRAWRIAANASRNNNVLGNVNSRAAQFMAEHIFPLEARFGATGLPNGRTVAQEIADFRQTLRNTKTAVEGRQADVLREWNGSLLTNYRFSEGRLKGASLGGNVFYRGPSVIGAIIDPVTNLPNFAAPIRGNGYTLVGLHARYERRFFGRYAWHAALHVRNLLDETRLIEKTASSTDGAVLLLERQEPRTWMLSTGVAF
jgi:outer membrane receptor protein involved in Fe transport